MTSGRLNIMLSEENTGPHRNVCRSRAVALRKDPETWPTEENEMTWKTPTIVEIALGAEINCYACAELK